MPIQSSYGSNYPYARDSFGRRYADYSAPSDEGVARSTFIVTLVAAVLFAVWSGATTLYLFFSDDILHRIALIRGDKDAQESQIAALTTEIERLRSSKFVDQEKIEQQLSDLSRMQRMIDARQSALSALTQAVTRNQDVTGSIPAAAVPALLPPSRDEPQSAPKPRPLSDTLTIDPPLSRSASVQSRVDFPRAATAPSNITLASAASSLAKLGAKQSEALNAIEAELDQRAERTKRAIAALGARGAVRASAAEPIGGPFVAYSTVPKDSFMRQVFRVRLAMEEQERLARQLDGLPLLLPVLGAVEITSGFGPRLDPFLRRLAMHSGVDIRGETGDPVRATAAGTVIAAERHRAYGLMVDIDHGNGIVTRYAHLSAISVKEGAKVPAGAIVGRIGTTGRSTGPHLHYEVRVNGELVDPRRYLRAGGFLAGFQ